MELCCLWIGGVMGGGTANGSAKKSKQQQQLHEFNQTSSAANSKESEWVEWRKQFAELI